MDSFQRLLFILGILILIAIIFGIFYSKDLIKNNPFLDKNLINRGTDKPALWLFYPSSEVNSRQWLDFGSRSTRALNIPFLNLCYESIIKYNKNDFNIRVISGVPGIIELLGYDNLPSGFKQHGDITPIEEAEMNWIRSAILRKYGGLFLNPATICLKSFGNLSKNDVIFFGTDLNETYAGKNGTTTPGLNALWISKPNHPMMVEWEQVCFDRINHKRGGQNIRGDYRWDFVRFSTEYPNVIVDPSVEGLRKKNGKRIQLEDLLATGTEGNLPFDVNKNVVYITFPWNELRDREMFGWFLRMSEKQIMDSDIAVKYLLQSSLQ